jgi:tRNA nucleotidyltransferase (CCA-adding enzyme)
MRINQVILHEEALDVKSVITSSIKKLDKVFKSNNYELRIVGGAVRDLALDKTPKDIDLATDATPDEMMEILDKSGIRHIPSGLEHGTITAILDNEPFEITTLRADKETDGRHAEVEFVKSWEEDAKRRDLTYNAMSMDMEGNVFDYFGGMDDLQDKVSKFVGDPEERITEDYLRILRYFRFQGRLSTPTWDKDTLKAISSNSEGLKKISAERVWQEMGKVLSGNNVANILDYMAKTGVSKVIGLSTNDLNKVKDNGNSIVALAQTGNTIDIAKRWKLSKVQATMLDFLVKNKNNTLDQKKVEDMIADGVDKELISALATLQGKEVNIDAEVPNFPITGADLIAKGMKPGPEIGAKLGQLKQKWKDSNFKSTKDELLKENSDLSTQRGRLEYYLKKPVEDGMLVHLSGLGKFHKGDDTLADIVPERNGMYALHPDKWESTFYSLTNKDFKKIVHYKPTLIKAPTDMIVADMAIANRFYRTDNPEEQEQLAKEYKDSIGKDISSMKMPEVIISTNESLTEAVHRFMTGHGVTFAGKKHDEIEIEVTGTDNVNKKYMVTILAPKELFGKQTQISSKYMNRGPWTKTKVDNVFGGE